MFTVSGLCILFALFLLDETCRWADRHTGPKPKSRAVQSEAGRVLVDMHRTPDHYSSSHLRFSSNLTEAFFFGSRTFDPGRGKLVNVFFHFALVTRDCSVIYPPNAYIICHAMPPVPETHSHTPLSSDVLCSYGFMDIDRQCHSMETEFLENHQRQGTVSHARL